MHSWHHRTRLTDDFVTYDAPPNVNVQTNAVTHLCEDSALRCLLFTPTLFRPESYGKLKVSKTDLRKNRGGSVLRCGLAVTSMNASTQTITQSRGYRSAIFDNLMIPFGSAFTLRIG